ncbi:hypothetical protein Droror1_Dr00025520 [Drosera rotundifolia]
MILHHKALFSCKRMSNHEMDMERERWLHSETKEAAANKAYQQTTPWSQNMFYVKHTGSLYMNVKQSKETHTGNIGQPRIVQQRKNRSTTVPRSESHSPSK